MGKASAGKAPDPYATAQAQGQSNDQTARLNATLNRGNTITPFGTVTNRSSAQDWQEDEYLAANADVLAGIRKGDFKSGADHYARFGQAEGRTGGVTSGYAPDQWTTTVNLSPEQKKIYDTQTALTQTTSTAALDASKRLSGLLGTNLDTSGLNKLQTDVGQPTIQNDIWDPGIGLRSDFNTGQPMARLGDEDYEDSRRRVEQSILDRQAPQQERDREALEARLAAQGVGVGSEAYDAALRNYGSNVNDARLAAVQAGGAEQSRLFGMDLSRMQANNAAGQAETQNWNSALASTNAAQGQAFGQQQARAQQQNAAQDQFFQQSLQRVGLGNSGRAQQLAEALQLRSQPINEVAALFGLGNGVTVPTAQSLSGTASQSGDLAGATQSSYQSRVQQAAAQNQQSAQTAQTIGMIAAMAFSDKRLKEDARKVGKLDNGLPVYAYRYKSGGPTQIGVMAQDVEKENPAAVGHLFGMKMVNYDEATRR